MKKFGTLICSERTSYEVRVPYIIVKMVVEEDINRVQAAVLIASVYKTELGPARSLVNAVRAGQYRVGEPGPLTKMYALVAVVI